MFLKVVFFLTCLLRHFTLSFCPLLIQIQLISQRSHLLSKFNNFLLGDNFSSLQKNPRDSSNMYVDISSDWLFFLTKLFTSDFKLFPGESLFSLSFKADDSADSRPSTNCEDIFVHFFVHFFASTVSSYCYFCCKCNHVYKRYINFIINIQNYIYKLNVNNK